MQRRRPPPPPSPRTVSFHQQPAARRVDGSVPTPINLQASKHYESAPRHSLQRAAPQMTRELSYRSLASQPCLEVLSRSPVTQPLSRNFVSQPCLAALCFITRYRSPVSLSRPAVAFYSSVPTTSSQPPSRNSPTRIQLSRLDRPTAFPIGCVPMRQVADLARPRSPENH